jgi:hypothetical protein
MHIHRHQKTTAMTLLHFQALNRSSSFDCLFKSLLLGQAQLSGVYDADDAELP